MTQAAMDMNVKIYESMRNFKVKPYDEVSKRLDEATKKTIERLSKDKKQEPKE